MTDYNTKIETFLKKHCSEPEQGRRAIRLLSRISKLDNDTLVDRLQNHDVQSGLASSMLQYRTQLDETHDNHYTGEITFNAPWAGAYITVKEDNWGADTLFVGDNALSHATVEGTHALLRATVKGLDALFGATVEGDNALEIRNMDK